MYNHTEQPDWKLAQRMSEVQELLSSIPYSQERRTDVAHELACLIFETIERSRVIYPIGVTA